MKKEQYHEVEEVTTQLYYPDGTIESWTQCSSKDSPTQEVATSSSLVMSQTKEGITKSWLRMNGKLPESYSKEGWECDDEKLMLITNYPDGSCSIRCPVIRRHRGFRRCWGAILFWVASILCLPLLLLPRVRSWFRGMLYEQEQLTIFQARVA